MKKKIVILVLSVGLFLMTASSFNNHFIILFLIGIMSSFVGTLAGGGGLISLPAMMLFGIPIQTSIATNKFSSGIAAFSSVVYLIQRKHLTIKMIAKTLLVAFIGGISGALFTAHVSEQTMNMIALILLVVGFVVTIQNKELIHSIHDREIEYSNKSRDFLIPLSIAAYDGGFGPGSSTFGILYYMKKHQTYLKAVQMTRVLIFGSCAGGFMIFYQTGFLQWSNAIAMATGSIIGSQIGLLVLPKVPLKLAKALLISIMCLLIIQMVFKVV